MEGSILRLSCKTADPSVISVRTGDSSLSQRELNLLNNKELDVNDLRLIPLAHAGWLRYLMAVDDESKPFEPSFDPLLETAQAFVVDFKLGQKP